MNLLEERNLLGEVGAILPENRGDGAELVQIVICALQFFAR